MTAAKKKEADRIKTQLMILGVMLVLVLIVNRQKLQSALGMGGGTKTAAPTVRPASQPNVGAPLAAPSPGVPADAAGPAAPAQTPFDIPALTPEVVGKLRARAANRPFEAEEVSNKDIEATINPFTSFATDIEMHVAEDGGRPVGTPTASPIKRPQSSQQGARNADVLRALSPFRSLGVMILDGEKQALVKREGRVVPYHLREGERLENLDFDVRIFITGDNRVWLEDRGASSADEKYYELGAGPAKPVSTALPPPMVSPPPRKTAPGGAPASGPGEPIGIFLDDNLE
ncbi:MAG: hypothetical protein HY814_13180 [Candidatus Riflebacteria bacterium]|nr:hypothetical protein [Candidatus Riflebacteria bacterium]